VKAETSEREREQRRREEQLPDELKGALLEQGFVLSRDQSFPMSSRSIELERGPLAIRIESDRGFWGIEVGVGGCDPVDIHLWREILDPLGQPDEVLTFVQQAAYLMSRLERIDELTSSPARSAEVLEQLRDLSFDRADRMWPGSNLRLEERLGDLIAEAGDVQVLGESPGEMTYQRNRRVFAVRPERDVVEFRLSEDIAEAAQRTPDTGTSARGADWVRFSPSSWDEHAADRLDAWFRVAWRFAGERR